MAIGFARVEFVKRSSGKNACAKAAYNSRSEIEFQGNLNAEPKTYSWSTPNSLAFHDILIPKHVHARYKDAEFLWNAVEKWETKANAQVAMEIVLALPDDAGVSLEDKNELTRTFIQNNFVDQGLAAQIDIHLPERRLIITRDNDELGVKKGLSGHVVSSNENNLEFQTENGSTVSFSPKEFSGYILKEHNWHAHVLLTTRRFKTTGLEFEDHKARDLMPRINCGRVVSGPDWGKLWAEHQNRFFQEKGLDLRVDPNGIVPQEHLGPYRMRARAFSLFDEHHRRQEANQIAVTDPNKILDAITSKKSVFTEHDVEHFFTKHVPAESLEVLIKDFWKQPQLVQLVDKQTGELLPKFTSQMVLEEEKQILRVADRLHEKKSLKMELLSPESSIAGLNDEQKKAFHNITKGARIALVQGYAGTGKSHLLKAVQAAYESAGYQVRAFGPDSATADVLSEKGLPNAENVYRFLFALHHGRRKISKGKELWILDEAGKLGNRPLLEFLKEADKKDVQVVFSGDASQLSPVERGGMFKMFCDRYGSQVLEDIQRQKSDRHREIAKNLATGHFGAAIDKLCSTHGIRWSENKREAIEELVIRWAQDTRLDKQSTLIVAHSNAEVRVLNEMVRLIRKQRGELEEKEFLCKTFQGDIFASVGDLIEFRKNDNDLGITNGLSGTLIEADIDRFAVSIRSKDKGRQTIVFNPHEYHAYQLGYASTYYRSQGRTVDRAYVLHHPMMNKEMFYVGLTRHIQDVAYFVSKDEAHCLADLKHAVLKTGEKPLTVEYTTQQDLNLAKSDEERVRQIQGLKESDSVMDKIKGYGLATWEQISTKTEEVKDRIKDRSPNRTFYAPVISESANESFPVQEILNRVESSSHDLVQGAILYKPVLESSLDGTVVTRGSAFDTKSMDKFSPEQQQAIKQYFDHVEKASTLKFIVDAEAESSSREVRFSEHFQQWQEGCGQRNQAAYELLQNTPPEGLSKAFKSKHINIIQDQANRYEMSLVKRDQNSKVQIEDELKTCLEPLLYRLYPEGPSSRDSKHFRFGRKGSLSVVHSGPKMGQFFDFEQQEGGHLLKLIQRELGLGRLEAADWAKNFLGIASEISVPKTFSRDFAASKRENEWVSLRPDPSVPAPKLEEIQGKKLAFYFTEVSRHAYKDENRQLLYYVLRLIDKNDPDKKITPPLSYGYWKSDPKNVCWELKGYHAEKSFLYNLHVLKENPSAPVLIVEGEKTADLASSKFPDTSYVCLSWLGGCGSAQRADWSPLSGRKVWIWPDNDQPGYQAAERICHELRKVGVESLQLVNKDDLKRHFPEKWDLADELPEGASVNLPQKLIASSIQKAVNSERVLHRLSIDSKDFVQRNRVNEVLWRVDERLRPPLESKHGIQSMKIEEEIIKETTKIFLNQDKRKDELKEKLGFDGPVLEKLNYQASILEAKQGRKLHMSEMHTIKEVIKEHGYVQLPKATDKAISDLALDKCLTDECERVLMNDRLKDSPTTHKATASFLEQTQKDIQSGQEKGLLKQNNLEKDTGKGIQF